MLMIVFHHFAYHGGFEYDNTILSVPGLWLNFIIMGGKIGVNLFVLISGYFLVQSEASHADIRKILKLWGQLLFYGVVIYGVSRVLGAGTSLKTLISAFLPVTRNAWWFASTYFVLYISHPYLNIFLHSMSRTVYQSYLLLLLLMWCIAPTFLFTALQSNNLLWFIALYSLAGYYRLYGLNCTVSKYAGFAAVIFTVLTYCSCVLFMAIGTRWEIFAKHSRYLYGLQSLPVLIVSFCTFIAFENWNIPYSKVINRISSATFGVYLIHENSIVRPWLWKTLFHNAQFQDSLLLIPYSVTVCAVVYVVCTLLELLRQRIVERPYMSLVNRYADKLQSQKDIISGHLWSFIA